MFWYLLLIPIMPIKPDAKRTADAGMGDKKEFILKFEKDKNRWMKWLFETKICFGRNVLNYAITSNHIHLLVFDSKENIIPKSIQLIAGRTGREYNQRKNRKGAFGEDLYPLECLCIVYQSLLLLLSLSWQ
jgi:hypothetical protein